MTKYRLTSTPMVYTPGIIDWATNGAKFEDDRDKMIEIVRDTYSLPHEVAAGLLTGDIRYVVNEDEGDSHL